MENTAHKNILQKIWKSSAMIAFSCTNIFQKLFECIKKNIRKSQEFSKIPSTFTRQRLQLQQMRNYLQSFNWSLFFLSLQPATSHLISPPPFPWNTYLGNCGSFLFTFENHPLQWPIQVRKTSEKWLVFEWKHIRHKWTCSLSIVSKMPFCYKFTYAVVN